jgi:hypothetical protein
MLQRRWMALSLGLCWLATSAQAVSFSLDMIPAGPVTSGNGQLEFSSFQFFSPFHSVTADEITLTVLDDGIEISGPVSVTGDDFKNFSVLYEVKALGAGIDGASLLLDSSVDADLGLVLATKQILGQRTLRKHKGFDWWTPGGALHDDLGPFDRKTLARLKTADWDFGHAFCGHPPFGGDGAIRLVEAGFDPQSSIRVIDRISLTALDGTAIWESSVNRFTVVPEPGLATLTLLGLTLLGWHARHGKH